MTAGGMTTRPAETLLTTRAADFLSRGPSTAAQLVSHVCQLPAVPGAIAEHMASALFAGRAEFVRETDGTMRKPIFCISRSVESERVYESTSPGRIATKLQPDAHCSLSCTMRSSPPQKIGSIGMPTDCRAAKTFGISCT